MTEFFRFPRTPHLACLGGDLPRDDKLLPPAGVRSLLSGEVVVEEKLDGANLGISTGPDGAVRCQNRGQYLLPPYSGQFSRLASWLGSRETAIGEILGENLILFGEWCAARHSLDYAALPDWFLVFDIYDREKMRFFSTSRRNSLSRRLGLSTVPLIFSGRTDLKKLETLVLRGKSRFRSGPLEGIVVRRENSDWLESRAKLVRPDFTQSIVEHWRRRGIEWNRLRQDGPETGIPDAATFPPAGSRQRTDKGKETIE